MRALELFAGIGGFAAAFPGLEIVHAVDIDQSARSVYRANFQSDYSIKEIASLPVTWFEEHKADLWWMSPPCTPFTHRGSRGDLDDPRSASFKHLVQVVSTLRPSMVCFENVVGFESSQAFELMTDEWSRAGYEIQTTILCPSALGWPNRRPRLYGVASRHKIPGPLPPKKVTKVFQSFLDDGIRPDSHPNLWLAKSTLEQYFHAMDRIAMLELEPVAACFAASYGKAVVRSGSYLETPWGYRRFSPREVARFLGFEDRFHLPEDLSEARLWHLLGNSLSLPALRHALGHCIPF